MHSRWRKAHCVERHNAYADAPRGRAHRDGYRDRHSGHDGGYRRPQRG
jgi:hypothetical protein